MGTPEGGGLIYQHHYDRDLEAQSETDLMHLIMWMQEWNSRNTYYIRGVKYVKPIQDSQAIAEIRKIFSQVRFLCMKYQEWAAVTEINKYVTFLTDAKELDGPSTLANLERLSETIARNLGVKHKFKDRTEDRRPWDMEIKKKLEFPEMTEEEIHYYLGINRDWKKMCWLITYYVVKCNGDAHILLSGPNLSGKSNTAIRLLKQCNWYLVNYWKVNKYNDHYIKRHPDQKGVKQDIFRIRRDVYITPDAKELRLRFESQQYQTLDINEGMEAATNLQSMKSDIVSLGVKRFTSRSYHNIVIWEYQVQQRPTAMMLEGMNFWIQKMKKRHFILSIASTLVRKKDPYYMEELNKCRTDKEIGIWMTKKNPNYVHTFRAPKLGPKNEMTFQMHYWKQKDLQLKGEVIKEKMGNKYNLMVEEIWNRVNVLNNLTFLDIPEVLERDMGFQDKDVASFMRDYGRFNRAQLYDRWKKKAIAPEAAPMEAKQ
jgi:hypothetical protein